MILRHHVPPHDGRPCICRICVCGHHHCPGICELTHLDGKSTYREHYPGKQPAERACSFAPHDRHTGTKAAPGHFMTTNQAAQEAGKGIPIDKAQSYKPKAAGVGIVPFGGDSTYHVDYIPHDVGGPEKVGAPIQALEKKPALPGTYQTTNQNANDQLLQAYRDGALDKAHPLANREGTGATGLPFDGTSCYREHYPGHMPTAMEKRPRLGDSDFMLKNAQDTRDFLTTHGAAYQKPPLEELNHCPASFVPRRPPSTDGHIKVAEVPNEFGQFPN